MIIDGEQLVHRHSDGAACWGRYSILDHGFICSGCGKLLLADIDNNEVYQSTYKHTCDDSHYFEEKT